VGARLGANLVVELYHLCPLGFSSLRTMAPPTHIPCCVPYWESSRFLNSGGEYTEALGFHVPADAYHPNFDEWLPRKWQFRGDPPAPVLLPDMLPSSTWEANLRTNLTEKEWDRLRRFCYQTAGNTCMACGSRGGPPVGGHQGRGLH